MTRSSIARNLENGRAEERAHGGSPGIRARIFGFALVVWLCSAGPAFASGSTITVSSTANTLGSGTAGQCTLRDALVVANEAADPALNTSAEPGGSGADGDCAGKVTGSGSPYTIVLSPGQTYTLSAVDNYWFGPDGLPPIFATVTIQGNGAKIARSSATGTPAFRFFYVYGIFALASNRGSLTLQNLTLSGGLAQGGNGNLGGAGAGMGGAILTQGTLALDRVVLSGNVAQGGSAGDTTAGGTGGGAGGGVGPGGGFGGPFPGNTPAGQMSGAGGSSIDGSGGGGGGLTERAGMWGGGVRGGGNSQNGIVDGGDGGASKGWGTGGNGGNAGAVGGTGTASSKGCAYGGGGGGGVGAGGGGFGGTYSCNGVGGSGGFGGGGGATEDNACQNPGGGCVAGLSGGDGGFGGGGGGTDIAGVGFGGYGGGNGAYSGAQNASAPGGGGAGMGGAVFSVDGVVSVSDSTVSGNTAVGGAGGSGATAGDGLGAGVFNVDGSLTVSGSTIASNAASGGSPAGGGVYSMSFGCYYPASFAGASATVQIAGSILSGNTGASAGEDDLALANVNPAPTTICGPSATSSSSNTIQSPSIVRATSTTGGATTSGTPITPDPLLGPLQNNGGALATMMPGAGSPALGAGTSCDATDEVGTARPASGCDLGAFEQTLAAPTVTITTTASGISQTGAAMSGSVNPQGGKSTYHFEVSTDPSFGSVTAFPVPDADVGAGTAAVPASANASGLSPGTVYYFRLVAHNSVGTTAGTQTGSFTTSPPQTLTVSLAGTGIGSVTGSGINCPGTCSTGTVQGTVITLTAAAGPGSRFTGWSGGGCSGTGTCAVTMSSDQAVTATFARNPTLTVTVSGTGSGTVTGSGIDCPGTCGTNAAPGTVIMLTPTAVSGSTFTGWSGGGCSGTGTCAVTLSSDQIVAATFQRVIAPTAPTAPTAPMAPTAPVLSAFSQSVKTWRENSALARISSTKQRLRPIGTVFSFALNEQANVTLSFTTTARGRKQGGRCETQTKHNASKPRCIQLITAGKLTFAAHQRTNKIAFAGRISHTNKLKPGHYTVAITATNTAREQSQTQSLTFTITA